jgi:hypothetical protein
LLASPAIPKSARAAGAGTGVPSQTFIDDKAVVLPVAILAWSTMEYSTPTCNVKLIVTRSNVFHEQSAIAVKEFHRMAKGRCRTRIAIVEVYVCTF